MAVARYKPETWTIKKLCEAYEGHGVAKLVIPRFQRMLVWSETKKRDLIQSIKQGYPIGSLLMYPRGGDGREHYLLIDGLQRSNALTSYRNQPTKWVEDDEMLGYSPPIDEILDELGVQRDQASRDQLCEKIQEWLHQRISFRESEGWSAFDLIRHLYRDRGVNLSVDSIDRLKNQVSDFLERLKAGLNVDDFQIPVVVYTGEFADLSEIFERLNSKGTKLNKYEIFAAAWTNRSANFTSKKIAKAIRDKYGAFASDASVQLEIDPETLGSEQSPFSLFEYFLGVNKALRQDFPYLFGSLNPKDETETESAAFNLIAAVLRIRFNEMQDRLPDAMPQDLDKFYDRIHKACEELNCILRPILSLPGNTTRIPVYHAEFQIITYVTRIYLDMWNPDGSPNRAWNESKDKFKSALPMHYLFDILSDSWAGHGDSHLLEMLGPRKDELLKPIPSADWDRLLDKWFDGQMVRLEKKSTRIDPTTILFLKYLYTKVQTHFEALSEHYDGEHLIPKNRLKSIIQRDHIFDGLPISNVGNISFLHLKGNRGKGDRTLLEKLESSPDFQKIKADIAKGALLESLEDLRFDSDQDDKGLTADWFLAFSRKRFTYLKKLFFEKYADRMS